MKREILLLLTLALAGPARAETVEASSTSLLNLGPQTRYRGGTSPDLVIVAPVTELLSLTARDITTGFTDDLRLSLSTWGSTELGQRRWDAGTASRFNGDVTTAYIQAKLLHQHLTVRAGRTFVATGVARMIQVDGGELSVRVPMSVLQLSASGFAGVPTSQRFQGRSGLESWNPVAGTLAYGGRAAVALPLAGTPGRGLELGGSATLVQDHADPIRREAGLDVRLQPFARNDLALAGFGTYSLYDQRWAEASAALSASPTARLHATADWRFVEPSLLLARNSILSVFTASTWMEYGGGLRYDLGRALRAGLDAHLRSEPGRDYGTKRIGSDVAARLDWESGLRSAGAELSNLDAFENGYVGARLHAQRELGRLILTGDVLGQFFRRAVNGQRQALTGTVTAAYPLPHAFSAVVAGSAGMTPYLEQTYNLMVKLAYNQTYRTAEVRK